MIVSELVLGRRYKLRDNIVKLVGYDGHGDLLVQFDDITIHKNYGTTTYKEAKNWRGWDNLIKFQGTAVGFSDYLYMLKQYEIQVKATDLAKFMYPTAKEEDGFLILEDF